LRANVVAPVRVLIVDDAAESREILRRALSFDPGIEVVGEAGSGHESVSKTEEAHPDVVLMDVRMPEGDGISATRDITRRFPGTRVIALTAYDDRASVRDMLTAGATGYLLKGASVDELVAAVRKARQGEGELDERVIPGAVEDLRHLLKEERTRRADAERLARIREDFIQVLSHELRTPLAVISGTLRVLETGEFPETTPNLVATALRRIEELEHVIAGLEMIGEGPAPADTIADPADTVAVALAGFEATPDSIEIEDGGGWPSVYPHHLARVVQELVSNAVRHGKRPVALRAFRQGTEGVVSVTDAGGFEPDPELFRPFVQADMSTQREQGGLGLGLFVAVRLCEANGGRLDMRREGDLTVAEARFLLG
jgi:DNA-binding NarL/FixJ family response regulator